MDNARDVKHNIFISRDCKCAMPYILSVLRKMLKHVFNSEIKFRLVSDNLCGIQYLRNPVSMSMSVFGAKLVVKWPSTPKIDYGPIFRLYPQLTPNFSRLKERI